MIGMMIGMGYIELFSNCVFVHLENSDEGHNLLEAMHFVASSLDRINIETIAYFIGDYVPEIPIGKYYYTDEMLNDADLLVNKKGNCTIRLPFPIEPKKEESK